MASGWAGVSLALFAVGCALQHEMGPIPPCNADASSVEWTWFGPSDPGERETLAQWCGVVGSPLVKQKPTAQFERPEAHDSLAVFSWNIDVGSGDLLTFLEEEVGLSCRSEASTSSPGIPHVVVIDQEAFQWAPDLPPLSDQRLGARKSRHDPHPGGDPDIAEVADQCGLALVYAPSGRNGVDDPGERLHDKGNAILSTLPLSDFKAVVLPFETERKVAVAATVPLSGSDSLRLVNAHLEVTTRFYRVLLTGNQTRLRQTEGLIEALTAAEESEGPGLPMLLGGDFNTWSGGESALKRLRSAFADSPEWDGRASRGPFPTDHLFFRRGSGGPGVGGRGGAGNGNVVLVSESYGLIEQKYSSDHRGRLAWIRFGAPRDGK